MIKNCKFSIAECRSPNSTKHIKWSSQPNKSDVKRETEMQRIQIQRFQIAKFEQWHQFKLSNIKGKLGDPGLLN